jgi:hypothetical protein
MAEPPRQVPCQSAVQFTGKEPALQDREDADQRLCVLVGQGIRDRLRDSHEASIPRAFAVRQARTRRRMSTSARAGRAFRVAVVCWLASGPVVSVAG